MVSLLRKYCTGLLAFPSSSSCRFVKAASSEGADVQKHVTITPFEPLGAHVQGIHLLKKEPLEFVVAQEIRRALQLHGLLLFRNQHSVGPSGLVEFASIFGNRSSLWDKSQTVHFAAEGGGQPDFPMVRALGNEEDARLRRLGYEWHSDDKDLSILYSEKALDEGFTNVG